MSFRAICKVKTLEYSILIPARRIPAMNGKGWTGYVFHSFQPCPCYREWMKTGMDEIQSLSSFTPSNKVPVSYTSAYFAGLLPLGWRNSSMKCALILALWLGLTCHAGTIEGRVVGVADGDTVTLLDADKAQHKIRLSGIDAPEKPQAFGNRSKESLRDGLNNSS